ncbi:MAG: TetR/AcrR family transcriptional regulator [Solirubrobacteraceae bacterium]|nr:TetR/AcrR family transcriptional regulator [Solirubrobacteraceae bacterium]
MEPSPSTGRKPDGRRARTSRAILDAAATLFFEQGLQRTTIDDIAEAAGVSVGSVYVHFGSKEGLYLALVEHAVALSEEYTAKAPDDPSPLRRVLNLGAAYVEFALSEPIAFRIGSMQMFDPAVSDDLGPIAERIAERIRGTIGRLRADLVEAMDKGEILRTDPDMAMTFLWGSWSGVLALTVREGSLHVNADWVRATLQAGAMVLERGLSVDPPPFQLPERPEGKPPVGGPSDG